MHVEKNGSDEISGGNQIGSDTFQNGSDIIRYPTTISNPAKKAEPFHHKVEPFYRMLKFFSRTIQ